MKKILLFAAAAAMAFTSCIEGGGTVIPEGETTITVKIAGLHNVETRAIESPASDNTSTPLLNAASVKNGWVYVLDPNGNVVGNEELEIPQPDAGQEIEDGRTFDKSSVVYILANYPANLTNALGESVTPASLTTLEAIKAAQAQIVYDATTPANSHNTNYLEPAMANVDGVPSELEAPQGGTATAQVTIAPLFARVELAGLTGTGAQLYNYEVAGVYLDNYYSAFSMSGEGVGEKHSAGNEDNFPAGWIGDVYTTPVASNGKGYTPGTNQVWAYHAGAATLVPNFIVKLVNVNYYAYTDQSHTTLEDELTKDENPLYLYVRGFTKSGADFTGPFETGKIYKIGKISFLYENLTVTINPNLVSVTAEVEVKDWEIVNLVPKLGE
jgi:hypothetical protein